MSEDDSNEQSVAKGATSEDSTLTLNDGVMSRQSSGKRKDSKYSKSRSPIMQSLNPTQLQPPSSILKATDEAIATDNVKLTEPQQGGIRSSFENKRSLQRTFRVDMNDPEQPLLLDTDTACNLRKGELETIHSISPPMSPKKKESLDWKSSSEMTKQAE